jgi:uncharacterized protein
MKMLDFRNLFSSRKPVIACIHLPALPGSPLYAGSMKEIYDQALAEAHMLEQHGVHGLLVENYRDYPFYPDRIPAETIAAMAAIGREIVVQSAIPVGVNALRNDAESAMAIATSVDAKFIRTNIHTGTAVTDQGIIEGKSHHTLRLRATLQSHVHILADIAVKHAVPLADRGVELETADLTDRGLADGLIITGDRTGMSADPGMITAIRAHTALPIIVGSGITPENLSIYLNLADGFIIGSTFKVDGIAKNRLDPDRVQRLMDVHRSAVKTTK